MSNVHCRGLLYYSNALYMYNYDILWCSSIVGVASYFIVGMIVMKVHYKASGTDIIPNKAFWKSLPTLIKV